jgi:hypothetical protein
LDKVATTSFETFSVDGTLLPDGNLRSLGELRKFFLSPEEPPSEVSPNFVPILSSEILFVQTSTHIHNHLPPAKCALNYTTFL